jgi:hypothetical protein
MERSFEDLKEAFEEKDWSQIRKLLINLRYWQSIEKASLEAIDRLVSER